VDLPDPLLGRTLGGRYRIESKLGAGGMATVYRASHDLLGRKVAVKFLAPELAADPTQKERFLREARATNRIKHEHIVDISDYGEEEGYVYLVMELLEGEPLANIVARGPMNPRAAIDYLTQTAKALGRAHELEVIHRDLKPENIFVIQKDARPHVKLLDFGLAHVRNEVRLTALGSIFGTPEYMSPEQARGQPVGPASDLYSLGVVFFEMLTSRLPFEGSTAELIVKHLKANPPTVASIVPTVPAEIDAVVAKMLTKDPAKRHRDAYHLIEDLTSLLTLLPGEPPRLPSGAFGRIDLLSATMTPVRADAEEHPTTVPISVRSWVERRTVYRRAMTAAYPHGGTPPWVVKAIERLEALVDKAVTIEGEMEKVARALAEREQIAGDLRGRIGRALDELARDESAVLRQLEDLERRVERAKLRTTQAATEFHRAWADALEALPDGVLKTIASANVVEAAARRATAWRQSMQEIEETGSLVELRRAARDDLKFQVAQLKGRLGAVNAEVEHELSALRDKASELGALMAATQEQLAEAGSALSQHLMELPASRPLITTGLSGAQAK
jgi:serine/threonine-protein kinase